MEQKNEEIEARKIVEDVNELASFFTSLEFKRSGGFSADTKQKMRTVIAQLQKALKDEITDRTKKAEGEEYKSAIDFSDLKEVIQQTQQFIDEVVTPLSKGLHVQSFSVGTFQIAPTPSPGEIKILKEVVRGRVNDYMSKVGQLSVGQTIIAGISALMRVVIGGIKELVQGVEAAKVFKEKNFRGYPIQKAAGDFAELTETKIEPKLAKPIPLEAIYMMGPEASGKTGIVKALCRPGEILSDRHESTFGIEVNHIEQPAGDTKGSKTKLWLWELGGGKKFKDTLSKNLEKADAVLITLAADEIMENEEKAIDTLKEYKEWAEQHAPSDAVIQFVVTKTDTISGEKDELERKAVAVAKGAGFGNQSVLYTAAKEQPDKGEGAKAVDVEMIKEKFGIANKPKVKCDVRPKT